MLYDTFLDDDINIILKELDSYRTLSPSLYKSNYERISVPEDYIFKESDIPQYKVYEALSFIYEQYGYIINISKLKNSKYIYKFSKVNNDTIFKPDKNIIKEEDFISSSVYNAIRHILCTAYNKRKELESKRIIKIGNYDYDIINFDERNTCVTCNINKPNVCTACGMIKKLLGYNIILKRHDR